LQANHATVKKLKLFLNSKWKNHWFRKNHLALLDDVFKDTTIMALQNFLNDNWQESWGPDRLRVSGDFDESTYRGLIGFLNAKRGSVYWWHDEPLQESHKFSAETLSALKGYLKGNDDLVQLEVKDAALVHGHTMNNTIWSVWDRNFNNSAEMLKLMVISMRLHNPDFNHIVITPDNIATYLPEYINQSPFDKFFKNFGKYKNPVEKSHNLQPSQMSDVLRVLLLHKFGGVYFDITTLPVRPVREIMELLKKGKTFYAHVADGSCDIKSTAPDERQNCEVMSGNGIASRAGTAFFQDLVRGTIGVLSNWEPPIEQVAVGPREHRNMYFVLYNLFNRPAFRQNLENQQGIQSVYVYGTTGSVYRYQHHNEVAHTKAGNDWRHSQPTYGLDWLYTDSNAKDDALFCSWLVDEKPFYMKLYGGAVFSKELKVIRPHSTLVQLLEYLHQDELIDLIRSNASVTWNFRDL
jgi:hypothetical protein